ncbi:hypothetical protein TSAR_011615, partial [Trichomalopsis sarcophagae]
MYSKNVSVLSLAAIVLVVSNLIDEDPAKKIDDEDCATFIGCKYFDVNLYLVRYVSRVCIATLASCRFYEEAFTKIGFETESCERCYTDLCNSSSDLVPTISGVATLLLVI